MKYCPTCDTRYDEDILRFCMKDGTPLLEEAEPNFIEMPSESLDVAAEVDPDDPSEHTVIRRNIPVPPPVSEVEQPPPPPSMDEDFSDVRPNSGGQRIVVPTLEEQQRERARVAAQYQAQPRRSGVNTALVVLVTIFGTIIVVGLGGIILYFLVANGSDSNTNANVNVNANQDINANTNLGANANFDFNTNSSQTNTNTNVNTNANVSTPSPTPTPSATPRPSESPSPTPDDDGSPTPVPSRTPIPTPSPIVIRPGTSPSPLRTPPPTPRTVITPRPSP
jgi:hypothetical protein